jgi:subtilisin family serine protease
LAAGAKTSTSSEVLPASADGSADATRLAEAGLPTYPHPQYKYTALSGGLPSGPLYSMEPFLNRISAPAGWAAATATNPAPIIAVIDTGFALNHQDLVNRWDTNPGEMGATNSEGPTPNCISQALTPNKSCNNLDNDGNGYPSDWRGWDFVDNDNNPMAGVTDPNGSGVFHGTMTAGLAALLNPNARIMPLQALSDEGVGYTDEIAAAVKYAADNGANVISLSLGSSSDDPYLHQEIDYAISKGVLVVAAAGNSGCNCLSYPAAYPEVLSVGATDANDNLASFSSYGSNLDVVAPGTAGDVCSAFYTSTNSTSAYSCGYSGTSFATPLVSSLAALLDQQEPGLTPPELIAAITQSADKVAGMDGQYDSLQYGYGRIDVAKAVAEVSIRAPGGQALNKQMISLSSSGSTTSPQMETTCTGVPGASCDITLTGPSNQIVDLGQQTLDPTYGGTLYSWNAATLGLATGLWTITTTETYLGQTTTLSTQTLLITP